MKKGMTGSMAQRAAELHEAEHPHKRHIVMVCVTRQRTCVRLVARGEEIAKARELPLHVVHAVKTGENFLGNADEGEALEYLFTVAQLSGGELSMLRADDVEGTLAEYALLHEADVLILGASPADGPDTFVARMQHRLPKAEFVVV